MIKAVIFDFDGLIIDTETPWFEVYSQIYREQGTELPLEEWARCIGSNDKQFDPYADLEARLHRSIDRLAMQNLSSQRHTLIMEAKSLLPGVTDYLKAAKALGIGVALASSSGRDWIEKYFKRFDLLNYFDGIFTREDVKQVKPSPELYQKALEFFGIHGNEAIAFEDSPNGLKAARAAGLYCVAIPNEITGQLSFENRIYDIRLHSMSDKALKDIIATFEGNRKVS
jgi:putative hydrolase of the HAD superfamily